MVRSDEDPIEWSKLILPIVLIFIRFAFILYALPGGGKNILNAIGMALVFAGAIWSRRIPYKNSK
ncbi:MAG: hypothetical protein AAF512_04570 [Pseudomonadota bacterium]